MNWKVFKTEKEYQAAIKRLEAIFDSKKGSKNGDELELLSLLIDNYETEKFPIDLPDPVEAIKFRMEQLGYNQKDLIEIIMMFWGFRQMYWSGNIKYLRNCLVEFKHKAHKDFTKVTMQFDQGIKFMPW